jgi:hypothetical protein
MSTSANVTKYFVCNKLGGLVGEHSQHAYCKNTIKEKLNQYQPAEDYTIKANHPDENECDNWSRQVNLKEYLEGKFKHTFWMSDEELAEMEDKANKDKLERRKRMKYFIIQNDLGRYIFIAEEEYTDRHQHSKIIAVCFTKDNAFMVAGGLNREI